MTKYKAKFKYALPNKYNDSIDLFYEYRDKEYMITKYNVETVETLSYQHRREQIRIDKELDNIEEIKPYDDSADKALKELFKLWES